MSDDVEDAGGAAAGEEPNVAGAAGADAGTGAAAGGALTAVVDGADGKAIDPGPGPSWGEKWREDLADGDEATLKLLTRLGSPKAMITKLLAQEQTIRRGAHRAAPELPENATDEQVAEYRKALGVPESPDGYGIEFAKEIPVGDHEKALAKSYAEFAHQENIPASQAKKSFDWYQQQYAKDILEATDNRKRALAQNDAELAMHYGGEYSRNAGLLQEWFERNPALARAVKAQAQDKGVLMEAIEKAIEEAPPEAFIEGGGVSGKSIEERLDELSTKNVRKTITPAEKKEYARLLTLDMKRQGTFQRNLDAA